jgi:NifU-like protein involved in Fe-S cluster formation
MTADPYSSLVRQLFNNTAHAGRIAGAVSAAKNEQGVRLELSGSANDGVVQSLRFLVYGCPHVIAVAEVLCAELEGQAVSLLEDFSARKIMQRLAVPTEKSGRILVIEDAVRLLGAALRESSSNTEQN